MRDGFIKVAAASVKTKVADLTYNRDQVLEVIQKAKEKNVKLLVLPELVLTGYTCNDLFRHTNLLERAEDELDKILQSEADK